MNEDQGSSGQDFHYQLIEYELQHLKIDLDQFKKGELASAEFAKLLDTSFQVIRRVLSEMGTLDAAAPGIAARSSSKDPSDTPNEPPKAQPPKAKIYWTKASILLGARSDPYNEEYAKAIAAKEIDSRTIGGSGGGGQAAGAAVAITGTVLSALSSTGYGAILVVAYAVLTLIGKYVIPPSSGGWEKLAPLQRLRAVLYMLTPDFERQRNETVFESQKMDLSVPSGVVPDIHTPQYVMHIRNSLIRGAYNTEFYRVTHTDDEATLPAVIVNILTKAKMWPPPLPPIKPEYFGPAGPGNANYVDHQWKFGGLTDNMPRSTDAEKMILAVQFRILSSQYEADIKKFNEVASIATLQGEILDLAKRNGCIPESAIEVAR